jgi:integrase
MKDAQAVARKVERLQASAVSGEPVDEQTANWSISLPESARRPLIAAGLLQERPDWTLGELCDRYLASRSDVKPSTRLIWGKAIGALCDHFGDDARVRAITDHAARQWQDGIALSLGTARLYGGFAKRLGRFAAERGVVAVSPFDRLKTSIPANRGRMQYVSRSDVLAVMDAIQSPQLRLAVALSRFGGLRCPSEHTRLRWDDVDLQARVMDVRQPKTERHHGATRRVPIIPELHAELERVPEAERDGKVLSIGVRGSGGALRDAIVRAGVNPWPRLWHQMRASLQTDLEDSFPTHVVCEWLGNSPAVARVHYLRPKPEHYARAVRNAVQSDAGNGEQQ